MRSINLCGDWNLNKSELNHQTIQVPAAVETVLKDRSFSGPFIYEKSIDLGTIDPDASYVLQFGGVSYYCEVLCNGKLMGTHEGIWDSFNIDITSAVQSGDNSITVKVIKPDFDKQSPYFFRSVLFGFIPDIMLPFGGIWKDVALHIRGHVYFDQVNCRFDTDQKQIQVNSVLHGTDSEVMMKIDVTDDEGTETSVLVPYAESVHIDLEHIHIWSPSTPRLYRVAIQLLKSDVPLDTYSVRAGFRKMEIHNGEIMLNGDPFYMRGVIHWGCYPEKFTPYPTYDEVKDELLKLKALGFNTVKHCLYFPPAYYYELCDELGIVTWQELPLWLPYDNEQMLGRIYDQYPKMLNIFMHYPSVSLVSLGCELDSTISSDTLNDLYQMVKAKDEKMIICDNSGSGECFEGVSNASSDIYDYHFYAELYNLDGLINEFTRSYRPVKPWLFGEYNDADTFRLVKNMSVKEEEAWWVNSDENINLLRQVHKGFGSDLPIYHQGQILDTYGIAEEVENIENLSYKQMHSIRKYILELTRSYKEIKGYNITTIKDVPITTSGIFDMNMEPKVKPEEMLPVNGDIVVTLNKDLNRVWQNGADRFLNKDLYNHFAENTLSGRLTLSNRSHQDLRGIYEVTLKDEHNVYFSFKDDYAIPKYEVDQLAQLAIKLPNVSEVTKCKLEVKLSYLEGSYTNAWDIWIYPAALTQQLIYLHDYSGSFAGIEDLFQVQRVSSPQSLDKLQAGEVLLTTAFDESVEKLLERGVQVIAVQKGEGYFPLAYNPFYREGVKVIFDHPVTNKIGHIGYAGMQFFGVGTDRYFDKLALEAKIGSYTSLLRRYDARKFAAGDYLLSYEKGKGKVLLTTLNLDGGVGSQPHNFKENNFAIWLLNVMVSFLG